LPGGELQGLGDTETAHSYLQLQKRNQSWRDLKSGRRTTLKLRKLAENDVEYDAAETTRRAHELKRVVVGLLAFGFWMR
jgi:hypothetical protein